MDIPCKLCKKCGAKVILLHYSNSHYSGYRCICPNCNIATSFRGTKQEALNDWENGISNK